MKTIDELGGLRGVLSGQLDLKAELESAVSEVDAGIANLDRGLRPEVLAERTQSIRAEKVNELRKDVEQRLAYGTNALGQRERWTALGIMERSPVTEVPKDADPMLGRLLQETAKANLREELRDVTDDSLKARAAEAAANGEPGLGGAILRETRHRSARNKDGLLLIQVENVLKTMPEPPEVAEADKLLGRIEETHRDASELWHLLQTGEKPVSQRAREAAAKERERREARHKARQRNAPDAA